RRVLSAGDRAGRRAGAPPGSDRGADRFGPSSHRTAAPADCHVRDRRRVDLAVAVGHRTTRMPDGAVPTARSTPNCRGEPARNDTAAGLAPPPYAGELDARQLQ